MGLQSQNDLSMISVHIIVSEIISVLGVAILNDLEWTGHHRYITVFQQLFGETNQAWKVVYVPIQKGYPGVFIVQRNTIISPFTVSFCFALASLPW